MYSQPIRLRDKTDHYFIYKSGLAHCSHTVLEADLTLRGCQCLVQFSLDMRT